MRKSRVTDSQILDILKQNEAGLVQDLLTGKAPVNVPKTGPTPT